MPIFFSKEATKQVLVLDMQLFLQNLWVEWKSDGKLHLDAHSKHDLSLGYRRVDWLTSSSLLMNYWEKKPYLTSLKKLPLLHGGHVFTYA